MKLSVSITTLNRPATFLETLRAAVDLSAPDVETELIIVDNGSDDPAMLALLDELARAGTQVIRNATNLGLSRAVNQGLAASTGDVLIHLDDDALVRTPNWDRVLASYFVHPTVGLVVTNPSGVGIPKGVGAPVSDPAFAMVGEVEASGPAYKEVSWGLGFSWALRRETYETVGGYDHILHQCECDLALRVRLAGYEVAGIDTVNVLHNDPGGPRSELSLAREHLGVVQFRDKYVKLFYGLDAGYGQMPLRLMPHWPPDQDFLRCYAEYHGVDLNPPPGVRPDLGPGATLGITPETLRAVGENERQIIEVGGTPFTVHRSIRNDFAFWERSDLYMKDREKAIQRYKELTGFEYRGYAWPADHLKPRDA